MNAFVILSEAKGLTTGVANIKCLWRYQSPRERSPTVSRFGMTARQPIEQPK